MKGKTRNVQAAGCAVFLLVFLAAALPGFGMDLSLKFSCGPGFFRFNEVNGALDGWRELREREAASIANWTFGGGNVKHLRAGFDIEGEILLNLTSRWALSVGAGTTYSEISEADTILAVTKGTVPYVYARPTKATGIPFVLSAYHFLPLGKKFQIYARAGAGWLWAKYVDRDATKKTTDDRFTYSFYQSASGRGVLYQAGLGFNYKHDQSLGFFGEASYRRANVDSMTGETRQGVRGALTSYDEYNTSLDFWQSKIEVKEEAPSGDSFRSVRKTVVDFSGFVLRFGIFIKF